MKRSYAELDSMKHEVDRQQQLQNLKERAQALEELTCPVCISDIDQYYSCAARIADLQAAMKVTAPPQTALGVYFAPLSCSNPC